MKEKIYHYEQEICHICKKEFDNSYKKHYKVRDHCIIQENIEVLLIIYVP